MKKEIFKTQNTMNLRRFILMGLLLVIPFAVTFAQDCGANLTVINNENVKTITRSDFIFPLFIENTGNVVSEYTITATNTNTNENPDGSSNETNVELLSQILDLNMNPITNPVRIEAGVNYNFLLKLVVPEGTPKNVWNCTEVKGEANSCDAPASTITLYVNNLDPNEHE